jgi:hypothetical protein
MFVPINTIFSILILLVFVSGCTCNCGPKVFKNESLSIHSEESKDIIEKTNETLSLLQNKEYNELMSADHIFSQQVLKNEQVMKLMKKALPCLNEEVGELTKIKTEQRSIQKRFEKSTTRQVEFIEVSQPVQYDKQDLTIVLQFLKEEDEYKLYKINWNSKNTKNIGYLQCFLPFNTK